MKAVRSAALIAITALALAGCSPAAGDGEEGSAATGEAAPANDRIAVPMEISLTGESISVAGAAGAAGGGLVFGTARETVDEELIAALGEPVARDQYGECAAGPMEFTEYGNGLTVNYQDGRLVGWLLAETEGANGVANTAQNIGIGSFEADVTKAYSVEPVEDIALGEGFSTDVGIGGFYDPEAMPRMVDSLYAGVTCFFR